MVIRANPFFLWSSNLLGLPPEVWKWHLRLCTMERSAFGVSRLARKEMELLRRGVLKRSHEPRGDSEQGGPCVSVSAAAKVVSGCPQARGAGPAEVARWVCITKLGLLLELFSPIHSLPASCYLRWPLPGRRPHRSPWTWVSSTPVSALPLPWRACVSVCAHVCAREMRVDLAWCDCP